MPPPTDPMSDEGFMKYIAKVNGMDVQTAESFVMGRAFKKQGAKLWEDYQAAPVVEEKDSESESSSSSEVVPVVDKEEVAVEETPPVEDEDGDSSSLESLSSDEESSSSLESDSSKDKVLSEVDQYILRQGWVPTQDDLVAFKSARSYAKKYLPLIEEALMSGGINNPQAAAPVVVESEDTPTTVPTPTYGAKQGAVGDCVLLSSVPSSWYSPAAATAGKTKAAYIEALAKMDGSSREAGVLKRKLSELSGDNTAFIEKVTKAVGGKPSAVRPLLANELFVGACIIRFPTVDNAKQCLQNLSGDSSDGDKQIVEFTADGVSMIAAATAPEELPEPQPDGRFTPFILSQPPDAFRVKRKRVFEKKEHPWWEETYSKKKEPAAAEVEKKKEEEKKEAVAKAKTFTEYIMAKMGLDQESLDSYMSSRKFTKVKDQLEKEYQDSLAA